MEVSGQSAHSDSDIFSVQAYSFTKNTYEGWNFNSGNYLFTTDTK